MMAQSLAVLQHVYPQIRGHVEATSEAERSFAADYVGALAYGISLGEYKRVLAQQRLLWSVGVFVSFDEIYQRLIGVEKK